MRDGLIERGGRIYTKDLCGGFSVYGERIASFGDIAYREWIPWRSKMGTLIRKEGSIGIDASSVLYLGAAQGTTVSHISDLIPDGTIYAVEFSPVAFRKLAELSGRRGNIVPILEDAFHPERYRTIVPTVDMIYQDVSQKDQSGLFIRNGSLFLKKGGTGIIMVKARSIDVTARPGNIYERFGQELERSGYTVIKVIELDPFQKDHAAIVVIRR